MTTEKKKVWKTIAIVVGALLIASAIGYGIYKWSTDDEPEDDEKQSDPEPKTTPSSSTPRSYSTPTYDNKGYTTEQVEKMQTWLIRMAAFKNSPAILRAIQETGGVDGRMGTGFNAALTEAIRLGWVSGLTDLYIKSIS